MGMVLVAVIVDPQQVAALRRSADAVLDLLENEGDDGRSVDVDKAWHAIHYLLTGSADLAPAGAHASRRRWLRRRKPPRSPVGAEGLAVLGGEPVGDDEGYGPARLLTAAQVADVAAALEPLDRNTLGRRVDLAAMSAAELYPQIWDEPDVYDEYVGPYYDELRAFYQRAAAAGTAVLLAVT